ncbi:MAG: tRNA dimethylallyltransferase [Methylothermaceae bacteria B42]|nr:MAG: tRNA dimethylallyltransferase [Methylothermaceae bacteria B42]HHJ39600.1 tRNA (adenosine(37)-N6)-dimethylallyltransferase MiaA [Methylothermaceae bacterium]
MFDPLPVVLLMGPTASGKSELAVSLARRINGEIISVDSSLVYRGMDIGTAKPPLELRAEIPHHLIDILDPAQSFSAGEFRNQALKLIEAVIQRGRLPILTGGTMLYFHALLNGLAELPVADSMVRAEIDQEARQVGWHAMHRKLAKIDPWSAVRIHPNDVQRIQRALEVYAVSGKSLSDWIGENRQSPFPFAKVSLIVAPKDRAILHRRIERRFYQMLEQGFIEEVRALYQREDMQPDLPSMRSVGYRQIWSYLAGEIDRNTMISRAIVATRQLAKRQFTWLRKYQDAVWLDAEDSQLTQAAIDKITCNINGLLDL